MKVLLGYVLICFFAAFPILTAMLAGWAGQLLGCHINEGGTDPCVKFGIPIGTILSMVFIVGWLALFTLPAGLALFILWTVKSFREISTYFKRAKVTSRPTIHH